MALRVEDLVDRIHDGPLLAVLVTSGGGSWGLAKLLGRPGASRTVLEAVVPYCETALVDWLGGRPDQACSPSTARGMAMGGLLRACRLAPKAKGRTGLAVTGALATDRPRRGTHRIHLALQTETLTLVRSLELLKWTRTRGQEEILAGRMLIDLLAEASDVAGRLDLELEESEAIVTERVEGEPAWQDLLMARCETATIGPIKDRDRAGGRVILPGAFNPIHAGHRGMAEVAREELGRPVDFEMSILNVDKPPLDFLELRRRTAQFPPETGVWLTRAATFVEKSRLFPGATFVVGADTIRRIGDVRYYGHDPIACRLALKEMTEHGCRFLVFGRNLGTGFVRLSDLDLPDGLAALCREVSPARFREDVSSREIRREQR